MSKKFKMEESTALYFSDKELPFFMVENGMIMPVAHCCSTKDCLKPLVKQDYYFKCNAHNVSMHYMVPHVFLREKNVLFDDFDIASFKTTLTNKKVDYPIPKLATFGVACRKCFSSILNCSMNPESKCFGTLFFTCNCATSNAKYKKIITMIDPNSSDYNKRRIVSLFKKYPLLSKDNKGYDGVIPQGQSLESTLTSENDEMITPEWI
jgi:hypothetical protein